MKKGRISDTKVEPAGITAEPEGILAGEGNNEPPAASADFVSAEAADTTEHQSADIVDMNDLPDMLEGFDEFEDFDFDNTNAEMDINEINTTSEDDEPNDDESGALEFDDFDNEGEE